LMSTCPSMFVNSSYNYSFLFITRLWNQVCPSLSQYPQCLTENRVQKLPSINKCWLKMNDIYILPRKRENTKANSTLILCFLGPSCFKKMVSK
jgi:hypothetical protein